MHPLSSNVSPRPRRLLAHGRVVRALTSAVLLILPALLAGSVAAAANAAPGDGNSAADPPGGSDVTLSWPALGLNPGMVLGPNSSSTFTVPVPTGLSAVRLRGMIHAPMNIGAGYLEIDDADGEFLAAVDLPPASSAQVVTPLDVDISAARAQASSVGLQFVVRPFDGAGQVCGPLQQLTLSDLSTVFTGAEPPITTVANFFAPVLQRVTVYAPTDADPAEQQAALTLVSTLARLYHPQPLALSVVSQARNAPLPPASDLARSIVVGSGPAGMTVENPGGPGAYLRLSGSGDELTNQVSLLVNQLQALAQAPAFRVDQPGADAALKGDTLTFSQLAMTGKTDVMKAGSVTVGVDRSALGTGRIESVGVHLLADYTPVNKDDSASLIVRSNGVVLYRTALDNSGRLDANFDVPSQAFTQWIRLEFALTFTPHQTCSPWIAPLTFQLDPRSTLTMHRGGGPLSGFGSVPSEFSPSFMVALDGTHPGQLGYAARAVAAISRLTGQALTPKVIDLKSAVDGNSGALIVAGAAAIKQTSLNPPLNGDGSAIDVNLPNALRGNIDGGLGSIQAFADRPRNRSVVLVTTTGAWSLVDPLFNYIEGLEGGWGELTGDVLAAGAAGTPTVAATQIGSDVFDPAAAGADVEPPTPWLKIGIGVAAVVVLGIIAATLFIRRRQRS